MTTLAIVVTLFGDPVLTQVPPAPATPPAAALRTNPCDAPAFRAFDFWLGRWEVFGPQGKVIGANVIEPIAGNCGVHEHWTSAAGGSGRSLNTFDRSDGKWHQVWVGAGGGMLRLAGGLQNGAMVMEGPSPGPNGTTVRNRITWTPLPGGDVRQLWETSADNGKTWTATFDGRYKKRGEK